MGDLLDPVRRAAEHVAGWVRLRRAADLHARERLQGASVRDPREVGVPLVEVRDGVERRGAGEQARMAADQEQRLVAAHAAADGIDAARGDAEPGQRPGDDVRHPREVVDLPAVSPRVQGQPAAHASGTHDGEVAGAGSPPQQLRVGQRPDAPPVRRDHERQRRRVVVRSITRRDQDERRAPDPVVRAVVDEPAFDAGGHAAARGRPSVRRTADVNAVGATRSILTDPPRGRGSASASRSIDARPSWCAYSTSIEFR